jgi:hypothetical protein
MVGTSSDERRRASQPHSEEELSMSTKKPARTGLIAVGVITVLMTGCGDTTSPEEEAQQACAAADSFTAALNNFEENLTPETTTGGARAARDEVQRTYEVLVDEGQDVASDSIQDLEEAMGQLNTAVDNVPDEATLSEAADSLRYEATQVEAARDNVVNDLACE